MQHPQDFFTSSAERKGIIALTMLVLLLLAIFLFAQTVKSFKESQYVGYDAASNDSITVSGTGEVKATPDMATFSFSAEADAPTQADAQTAMATKANMAISYLKAQGVADKDIQTSDYSVSQKYDMQNENQVADGFTASESVNVTLRNLGTSSNTGAILQGVANEGATNVSDLSFAVVDQTDLQAQARSKAIDDAKSQAEKLADELGVRLVSVESFSENAGGGPVPLFRTTTMDAAASAPEAPQIERGQNTVSSNVSITYRIK